MRQCLREWTAAPGQCAAPQRTFVGGDQGGSHELIAALADNASLAAQQRSQHVRCVAATRQLRDGARVVRRRHAQVPGRVALDIGGQLNPLLRAHHGRAEPERKHGGKQSSHRASDEVGSGSFVEAFDFGFLFLFSPGRARAPAASGGTQNRLITLPITCNSTPNPTHGKMPKDATRGKLC